MFLPDLDETTKYFETFKSVANPASASSAAGKSFSGTKSALLPIRKSGAILRVHYLSKY